MVRKSNFGKLVSQHRKDKKISAEELAFEANIDKSHLFRIEKGSVIPPAATIVSLCTALNVSIDEAYVWLTVPDYSPPSDLPTEEVEILSNSQKKELHSSVLYLEDVSKFSRLLQTNEVESLSLLAKLIGLGINPTDEVAPEAISWELLTQDSPVEIQVKYPEEEIFEVILKNFQHGGVITLQDAGSYTKAVRKQREYSIRDVQSKGKISISVLSRIENGQTERIRMDDILNLYKVLEDDRLFEVFWRAFGFYNQMTKELKYKYKKNQEYEYGLTTMMINSFRKLQLAREDLAVKWLEEYRRFEI